MTSLLRRVPLEMSSKRKYSASRNDIRYENTFVFPETEFSCTIYIINRYVSCIFLVWKTQTGYVGEEKLPANIAQQLDVVLTDLVMSTPTKITRPIFFDTHNQCCQIMLVNWYIQKIHDPSAIVYNFRLGHLSVGVLKCAPRMRRGKVTFSA